jgi:hypothetical protein
MVNGSYLLHSLTEDIDLDFFVMCQQKQPFWVPPAKRAIPLPMHGVKKRVENLSEKEVEKTLVKELEDTGY